jgi:23S rRNA pseudouridine1911/1915/1917 synthase
MNSQKLKVLYEDNHLIAVHKPGGWLVQGDSTGDKPLSDYVKEYIKVRYKKEGAVFLGVIHRLDRPVSGLVIFARTSKALTRMNELFKERKVKKTYFAIVGERPKEIEGRLTHFLVKDKEKNRARASVSKRSKDAKESQLDYTLLASIANHHLLEVKPLTGRPHQIRVQLAKINCSIRGDLKYGSLHRNRDGCIHLHSHKLEFIHPVKKTPMEITCYPPKEQLWDKFGYFIKL